MRTFLIVAGAAWFSLATLMVLAIACAARRRMPQPPRASRPPTNPLGAPVVLNSDLEMISKQPKMESLAER